MRHLRLLIIAVATICVLALVAFALVNHPPVPVGGDDIIIKGGSLEIQCGSNHGTDCLGTNDSTGKYKHKQASKHIMAVAVRLVNSNANTAPLYSGNFNANNQPQIEITYK